MSTLRSIAEVVDVIAASASRRRGLRTVVGIVGPPGAGKSTIAATVVERLNAAPHTAALLPMDGFHLPQSRLIELRRRDRMGAPDTFDVDGLISTLQSLRAAGAFAAAVAGATGIADSAVGNSGDTVYAPDFDRAVEEAVPGAIAIGPEFPIVVVEGNYLLLDTDGWGGAVALIDLTFFVQVDRELRLTRLTRRHERFGKSPDAAHAWALGPDEANARLINATRPRATHIIELQGSRDLEDSRDLEASG